MKGEQVREAKIGEEQGWHFNISADAQLMPLVVSLWVPHAQACRRWLHTCMHVPPVLRSLAQVLHALIAEDALTLLCLFDYHAHGAVPQTLSARCVSCVSLDKWCLTIAMLEEQEC